MHKCLRAKLSLMSNSCKLKIKLFIIAMNKMFTLNGILKKLTMKWRKTEERDTANNVSRLLISVKKHLRIW